MIKTLELFLRKVEEDVCVYLENERKRFPSYHKLINKFRDRRQYWITGEKMTKEIIEVVNELCVAKLFLEEPHNLCKMLEYEPKNDNTLQSIDFHLEFFDLPNTVYCDVKTIHPDFINDWVKFEQAVNQGRIPKNIKVHIEKDFGGGEYWHQWTAARSKMREHTLSLEAKIKKMQITDATTVMLFCGNGFQLRLDLLEDFSDCYKMGRYRHDDIFSAMEEHYMESKQVTFSRTIDHIAYVQRSEFSTTIDKFVSSVQGPREIY
jgi:hypothetical protein